MICRFRLLFWWNVVWQKLQENGFSPVWVKICFLTSTADFWTLKQNGQAQFPWFILIGSFCKYQVRNVLWKFCLYICIFKLKGNNFFKWKNEQLSNAYLDLFFDWMKIHKKCKETVFLQYELEYVFGLQRQTAWFENNMDKPSFHQLV